MLHNCVGRVRMVRDDMRGSLLLPPSFEDRDISVLLARVGTGCISDTGCRVVDPEEWE